MRRFFNLLMVGLFCMVPYFNLAHGSPHHHHHYHNSSSLPNCDQLFARSLQTHGIHNHHDVNFSCGATTTNNIDNILSTKKVINPNSSCADTCGDSDCVASGATAATIDVGSFQEQSGGSDITVNANNSVILGAGGTQNYNNITVDTMGTLTFSTNNPNTTYKIDKLTTEANSTVNLAPGDYWIKDNQIKANTTFNISGTGTVRLYFNDNITIQSNVVFNSIEANPAKQLFIYSYKSVTVQSNTTINAFIYSSKKTTVEGTTVVVGAISGKEVDMKNTSRVTYDSIAAQQVELGNLCVEGSSVTHFVINTANVGSFCAPHQVIVTAKNSTATVTDYTGSITLDTGTNIGSWTKVQGAGSFADTNTADGKAIYTFASDDNGQAIFALTYNNGPSPIDVETYETANDNIRDDDTEGTISFAPYAIWLTEAAIVDINNVVPFAANMTAGVEDTVQITAYGQVQGGNVCGIVTDFTGSQQLKFWFDYVDPNTGALPILFRADLQSNTTNNLAITENAAGTYAVAFSSGVASVGIKYRDVGKLKMHTALSSNSSVSGSTNNFVVKPATFALTIGNNPGAADASGGIFKKAGEAFSVVATVQDIDGNTTPNYGNEAAAEGIEVYSSTLVAPVGGRNGTSGLGILGNGSAFTKSTPGVFTANNVSFDEVGIIKINARVADQNYIGAGNVSGTETGNIGRFTPNNLSITANTPSLNSGCIACGFTYLGQSFTYSTAPQLTVTARNVAGGTTINYANTFYKLSIGTISAVYSSNSTQALLNSALAEADINVAEQGNGVALISLDDGGGISFSKVNGIDASPFNAELALAVTVQDSDSIAYASNPYTFGAVTTGNGIAFNGGKAFYQGRVGVKNANGSELINLTVPFIVEYFNGTDYIPNTLDSATQLLSNNITLTPSPGSLNTSVSIQNQVGGIGAVILAAPSPAVTGYVDVEVNLSSMQYLQHDWPHDGNVDGLFNDNPVSRGTFGIYSGDPNVIYMRELY